MSFETDQIVTSASEVGYGGPTTLVLNGKGVAGLFGRSTSWFYLRRPELEEAEFLRGIRCSMVGHRWRS